MAVKKKEQITPEESGYLAGQLIIATPSLQNSYFSRTVIYVCVHNKDGAMGIVVNKPVLNFDSRELLKHLDLNIAEDDFQFPIYSGGPVEPGRGFVLHGGDYENAGTMVVADGAFGLTSNLEVLEDIASARGPADSMIALGYVGWSAHQLDAEILANSWLTVPASKGLVFDADNSSKWALANKSAGVDPLMYSEQAGHA